MKRRAIRLFSLVLALVMCLCLLPASALADYLSGWRLLYVYVDLRPGIAAGSVRTGGTIEYNSDSSLWWLDESEYYTIDNVYFTQGGSPLSETATLPTNGGTIRMFVTFTPKSGYFFTNNSVYPLELEAKLLCDNDNIVTNNVKGTLVGSFSDSEVTAYFDLPMTLPVGSVALNGFTAPTVGGTPDYDFSAAKNCTIRDIKWTYGYTDRVIDESQAFAAQDAPVLRFTMVSNKDYRFTSYTDWYDTNAYPNLDSITIYGLEHYKVEFTPHNYDEYGGKVDVMIEFPDFGPDGWYEGDDGWSYYYYDAEREQRVCKSETWLKEKNTWYYFDSYGIMATGWQKISNVWYWFKDSGAMATGWQKINNVWYYFLDSGAMATGWQKIGNVWYYFQSSGAMATGWQKINNVWYYFQSSGAMAEKEWIKDGGVYYWLSAGGAWTYKPTAQWYKNGTGWWFQDTSGWYAKNETVKIDGRNYTFNAAGYWDGK